MESKSTKDNSCSSCVCDIKSCRMSNLLRNNNLFLINTETGSSEQTEATNEILLFAPEPTEGKEEVIPWDIVKETDGSIKVKIPHQKTIKHLAWHSRGDYLSAVCPDDILYFY